MTSNINKEALTAFIDVVDEHSQGLIPFERAVQLTTAIGFSCRLACQMEKWHQSITLNAPPSTLSPVEAEIHTPWGDQNIELEQRSSLPRVVENALSELRHILDIIGRGEGHSATTDQRQEFVVRAREMERTVIENSLQFASSRFLQLAHGPLSTPYRAGRAFGACDGVWPLYGGARSCVTSGMQPRQVWVYRMWPKRQSSCSWVALLIPEFYRRGFPST